MNVNEFQRSDNGVRGVAVEAGQDCRLILLSLFFYVMAAALIYPADYKALLPSNIIQLAPFFLSIATLVVCFRACLRQPSSPLEVLRSEARQKAGPILLGVAMFILGMTAFTTFKVNIPHVIPFYADPALARIDEFLHGGNLWTYAYRVPPQFAIVIDFFYTRVWPGVLLTTFCIALIVMRGRALQRYLWAFLFVYVVLGGLIATLVSSVGPIFYADFYPDSHGFSHEKAAILSNSGLGNISFYANYLLENYRSAAPAFGKGISAFPSVHVAVATMSAWLFTSFGRRWAIAGWLFAAMIEFGSIYTGWHYAVGGYTSMAAVSVFWIAISRYYRLPLMPVKARSEIDRGLEPIMNR